ncbi:FtsK/SpoIIIE domain-containing protein [Hufsiella ginkgonis]|uniref:FtsK domain-containing protein n=1 Tax=Hufsiella ginkgonis TaxID=2695274 RepID=A0A7K1XUX7_9SPHI|nr:FtsK/SpoIIIE domain-containing protein [Hufsiella ginkgonis]MXV14813.1 hypothetical protein [Hufsiella ginkgonis]
MQRTELEKTVALTVNAPDKLEQLSNEYLQTGTELNSNMLALDAEIERAIRQHEQTLNYYKSKHRQQIADKRAPLDSGEFVYRLVDDLEKQFSEGERNLYYAMVVFIIIGMFCFFGGEFGTGLFIGGIGGGICYKLAQRKSRKLVNLRNACRDVSALKDVGKTDGFTAQKQQELRKAFPRLGTSIDAARKLIMSEIEYLDEKLTKDYNDREKAERERYISRRREAEYRCNAQAADLCVAAKTSAEKINSFVKELNAALNRLPETFDPKQIGWDNASIFKEKDQLLPMVRLGSYSLRITLDHFRHLEIAERSTLENIHLTLPLIVPFPGTSALMVNFYNHDSMQEAVRMTHNLIARMLLSLSAGKVRISFVDPLELGGNAAPFLPLLREIYGGSVHTQGNDIDNQLSALIRIIENIIQKYLQHEFKNISEYNARTKEVPEPYRFLVIYNFPSGFTEATVSKLMNVIKSGPKAGVYTILVSDRMEKFPGYNLTWEDVEKACGTFDIDMPTSFADETEMDEVLPYNKVVERVNLKYPNAATIKVPITKYVWQPDKWWQGKAARSIRIPIGRHGTELQFLEFDNDDNNQALLIGKPGSGKSNLMHVIISNAIWLYSPDELEIYLIDFKGGVEFAVYAEKHIPHIRTIAIESDREFGLSVLDAVEKELLRRETVFSSAGVQNLEQYHQLPNRDRMPRIMLIVDEFQEFYAEDDSIKQAVDDKLDRIIRKGRAFGINTLFSSQTLAGNSIKKSTKELIGIRIALMCSELDALQILDDRNSAARDLTRPGEGIYNADGGKNSGNRTFQSLFVDRSASNQIIDQVATFARSRIREPFRQIIFRGSEKARIERADHPIIKIKAALSHKALQIWVGEPVTIADDIVVTLRKQGGGNMLIVGYDEQMGLRIMTSALISIAAQHLIGAVRFYGFNFQNVDSDYAELPQDLFEQLCQPYEFVAPRDVEEKLEEVKAIIDSRIYESSIPAEPVFLTFFSFQRGRSFRKAEYSMSAEAGLLAFILKEGPDVGVHVLLQVDSLESLSKSLDHNLLREFSQRIVYQMNADSSTRLIGNSSAGQLGQNRAIHYDDNENTMIKFKPYEIPALSWVTQLRDGFITLS